MFTLSVATAAVSVDTFGFGQPNTNHHFNMISVNTLTMIVVNIYTKNNVSTLTVAVAMLSANMLK